MNETIFNKIQYTITFLSNHYSYVPRNYRIFEGFYMAYERKVLNNRPDVLSVFEQLVDIPFESLFTADHKAQWLEGSDFIEGNCAIFNEQYGGVHLQITEMLYYYLFHRLSDNINHLLTILKSQNFRDTFQGLVFENDTEISYRLMMHDDIDAYLKARVPSYSQLAFLFNEILNDIIVEGSNLVFRVGKMEKYLEDKDNVYDFSNLNIE